MSDNLGDFFAKQKAKKQKNQKGQGKDASAIGGASTATGRRNKTSKAGGSGVEETKTESGQLSSQQAQSQQQDFVESSDEETNIELDANVDAIKDTKEIEATKRKEEEKELSGKFGWAGLDKKSGKGPIGGAADEPITRANAPVDVDAIKSRAAGGGAGMITFGRGPPKFTKAKNMINQSEFPELGDVGKKGAATSGKDSTSIGHFGSSIAGAKPAEGGGPSFASAAGAGMFQESKGAPKMPIFKGKAKLKTGGEATDDSVPSKQNYDFSSMKMSASTSKTAAQRQKEDGEDHGEGKREYRSDREDRGERRRGDEGRAAEFEDDFEEVTDKKRAPTFSRGGRTFGQF